MNSRRLMRSLSGRRSHPTTLSKNSLVVHHSNFGHPTSAVGHFSSDRPACDGLGMSASLRLRPSHRSESSLARPGGNVTGMNFGLTKCDAGLALSCQEETFES